MNRSQGAATNQPQVRRNSSFCASTHECDGPVVVNRTTTVLPLLLVCKCKTKFYIHVVNAKA